MNIITMKSEQRISPFAPEWQWVMGEDFLENIDWDEVATIILEKEKEIIEKFPPVSRESADGYTGLGNDSLTSRYTSFNVLKFDYAEIRKIYRGIQETHLKFLDAFGIKNRKIWVQCWANVLRDDQEIKPHLHSVHPYTYLGGHIAVQCNEIENKTSTVYINPINQINNPEIYSSENVPGKITLFQNNIPHYTTIHKGSRERISIAFDLILDEFDVSKDNMILLD